MAKLEKLESLTYKTKLLLKIVIQMLHKELLIILWCSSLVASGIKFQYTCSLLADCWSNPRINIHNMGKHINFYIQISVLDVIMAYINTKESLYQPREMDTQLLENPIFTFQ